MNAKSSTQALFIFLAGILSLLMSPALCANLVYSQTFNTSGSDTRLDSVNWQVHYDSDNAFAYALDDTNFSNNPYMQDLASGGGDDSGNGVANGFLYQSGTLNGTERHIYWTDDFTPFSVTDLDRLEVDTRFDDGNESAQFAVRVDTDWYFFNDPLLNSPNSTTWENDQVGDASTVQWRELDFTPGTPGGGTISSGATVSRPGSGNVTAVGIYNFDHDDRVRFDNFEVYAIPEPASFVLVALAFAATTLTRRSRS